MSVWRERMFVECPHPFYMDGIEPVYTYSVKVERKDE
jgi:hypothetical protein